MNRLMTALLSVVLSAATLGQPEMVSLDHLNASTNDKQKGRMCYKGTCTGCTKDCSKKKTTTACYLCVQGQCSGNVLLEAQKFCDGTYTNNAPRITANDNGESRGTPIGDGLLELSEKEELTLEDVQVLDQWIVKGDTFNAKLATAILLETPHATEAIFHVGEIHFYLLMYAEGTPVGETARKVFDDFGLQGDVEITADELYRVLRHGDPRLVAAVMN